MSLNNCADHIFENPWKSNIELNIISNFQQNWDGKELNKNKCLIFRFEFNLPLHCPFHLYYAVPKITSIDIPLPTKSFWGQIIGNTGPVGRPNGRPVSEDSRVALFYCYMICSKVFNSEFTVYFLLCQLIFNCDE